MMSVRRKMVGAGLGAGLMVAALSLMPSVAGATGPQCVVTESMTEPGCATIPLVDGNSDGVTPVAADGGTAAATAQATTSSLPFTGADVEELAVIGVGAVVVGGVLARRRHRKPA